MTKKIQNIILLVLVAGLFAACNNTDNKKTNATNQNDSVALKPLVTNVLSAEDQSKLTPDLVLQDLKEGNIRFMNNKLIQRNYPAQAAKSSEGQYPEAIILACIDSRVPVEYIFDKGIGDIFTARVAGNFVNEDILGSMEYACKVAGSKLILVMGHESCGAVKAAVDNVKMGNITEMLTKIEPAIKLSENFQGKKTSKNPDYLNYVGHNNVLNTIETIKKQSPVLKEMADKGEIKIIGAFYEVKTGKVEFME